MSSTQRIIDEAGYYGPPRATALRKPASAPTAVPASCSSTPTPRPIGACRNRKRVGHRPSCRPAPACGAVRPDRARTGFGRGGTRDVRGRRL